MKRVLCLLLCLFSVTAHAGDIDLKGLAVVRIKSKRISDLIMEQAILIQGEEAHFMGLNDFGAVAFVVRFSGNRLTIDMPSGNHLETSGKKLKNILSLPLSQNEFLGVIRYERPRDFREVCEKGTCSWMKQGKKALSIVFSDFKSLKDFGNYPYRITLTYKKSIFDLKWQNVTLQSGL